MVTEIRPVNLARIQRQIFIPTLGDLRERFHELLPDGEFVTLNDERHLAHFLQKEPPTSVTRRTDLNALRISAIVLNMSHRQWAF